MRLIHIVTTALLVVLGCASAATAQPRDLGGVLDTLSGILGGSQKVHGHVVLVKDTTLVFRSDDGRTLAVETSSLDPRVRALLQPGDGVALTLRTARAGDRSGSSAQGIAASAIEPDPAEKSAKVTYQRVEGTIQETKGSQVLFKTREGLPVSIDVSTIKGLPALSPNEPATLYYEPGKQQAIAAVWIEPGGIQPSAAVPSESAPIRVRGLVESVAVSSVTLNADDGRTLTVDTTSLDAETRRQLRPGDLVTVSGRPAPGRTNAVVAESVQRE